MNASGITYTVGFVTSRSGGLDASGSISITTPAGTRFGNDATVADITTGVSCSTLFNADTNAVSIPLACLGSQVINAHDHVSITIPGNVNGPTVGAQDVTVATSADTAVTRAAAYSLVAQQAVQTVGTLTVSPTRAVNATGVTYSLKFVTSSTGGLAAAGSISITTPAGTRFGNDATITDTTTGVAGSTLFNANTNAISIPLGSLGSQVINPRDHVTITIPGSVNGPVIGAQGVTIATSSDTATTNPAAYTLVAQQAVASVAAMAVSPTTAVNASGVSYTIKFVTSSTGGLSAAGAITLTTVAGTRFGNDATITDTTTGVTCGTFFNANTNAVTIPLGCLGAQTIGPRNHVTLTIVGNTNAPSIGTKSLSIATSSDRSSSNAAAYTLVPRQQVEAVSATSINGEFGEQFSLSFVTSSSGGMAAAGGLAITAPSGTRFGNDATITDLTTNVSCSTLYSANTNVVSIPLSCLGSQIIKPGDHVTVGIPNTAVVGTGTKTIRLATTSDTTGSGSFTLTQAPVILPFGASGWAYQQVANGAGDGFQAPTFDDSAWPRGQSGFGSTEGYCVWNNATYVKTPWTLNTDMLLRHQVTVPAGVTQIHITGTVDNDAVIYLNGNAVFSVGGGNCPAGDIDVTATVPSGTNELAIRASDVGVSDFIDVQVSYSTAGS